MGSLILIQAPSRTWGLMSMEKSHLVVAIANVMLTNATPAHRTVVLVIAALTEHATTEKRNPHVHLIVELPSRHALRWEVWIVAPQVRHVLVLHIQEPQTAQGFAAQYNASRQHRRALSKEEIYV